jgi:maspardin
LLLPARQSAGVFLNLNGSMDDCEKRSNGAPPLDPRDWMDRLRSLDPGTQPTPIAKDPAMKRFHATVPKRTIFTRCGVEWVYYDCGPDKVSKEDHGRAPTPMICLHGTSGRADSFFWQLTMLPRHGYRVIAVELHPFFTHLEWARGFDSLLRALRIRKCHLYGASLGGFLAQVYATQYPDKVASLALTNSFLDTAVYHANATWVDSFRFWPASQLRQYVLNNFPKGPRPLNIALAIGKMQDDLGSLEQRDLACRLTLNCIRGQSGQIAVLLKGAQVTFIDSNDGVVLPGVMRKRLYETYPGARQAFVKRGGDFPYLACPEDTNLHLIVHLRAQGEWGSVDSLHPKDGLLEGSIAVENRVESCSNDEQRVPLPELRWGQKHSNAASSNRPRVLQPEKETTEAMKSTSPTGSTLLAGAAASAAFLAPATALTATLALAPIAAAGIAAAASPRGVQNVLMPPRLPVQRNAGGGDGIEAQGSESRSSTERLRAAAAELRAACADQREGDLPKQDVERSVVITRPPLVHETGVKSEDGALKRDVTAGSTESGEAFDMTLLPDGTPIALRGL